MHYHRLAIFIDILFYLFNFAGVVVNQSNMLRGQLPNTIGIRMPNTSPGPAPSSGANQMAVQLGQHQSFGQTSQQASQQSINMPTSMPSTIQSKLQSGTTVMLVLLTHVFFFSPCLNWHCKIYLLPL